MEMYYYIFQLVNDDLSNNLDLYISIFGLINFQNLDIIELESDTLLARSPYGALFLRKRLQDEGVVYIEHHILEEDFLLDNHVSGRLLLIYNIPHLFFSYQVLYCSVAESSFA